MSTPPPIDWASVEVDYRAGTHSLRVIAGAHQVPESTIRKRAAKHGWVRTTTGAQSLGAHLSDGEHPVLAGARDGAHPMPESGAQADAHSLPDGAHRMEHDELVSGAHRDQAGAHQQSEAVRTTEVRAPVRPETALPECAPMTGAHSLPQGANASDQVSSELVSTVRRRRHADTLAHKPRCPVRGRGLCAVCDELAQRLDGIVRELKGA